MSQRYQSVRFMILCWEGEGDQRGPVLVCIMNAFRPFKWLGNQGLSPERSVDELGDVHDLQGHLVSFDIGRHGSDTLLAGGDDRLCAGTQRLFDFLFSNLPREFCIDHLEIAADATEAVLPIAREFSKLDTGDGTNDGPRFDSFA